MSPAGNLAPSEEERGASALLNTMALFKANYNDGRDYLANFEPFVADVLKEWPSGQAVGPEALRDGLGARFSIPSMPINTADVLRVRAVDHRWVRRSSSSDFFPDWDALSEVPGLMPGTHSVLKHLKSLIESLRGYAAEVHHLEWSHGKASEALERFVEEFSFELAMARRQGAGDPLGASSVPDEEALIVVNGFVRRAFARDDSPTMRYLEEMVQGSMLANVLYFHDLGQWAESLSSLIVYLDTTVALRVLGLTHDSLALATAEMLDLLKQLDVNVRIFEHTVDEMHGVLVGVAASLREGRATAEAPKAASRMNREVSDSAVQRGLQSADVEAVAADLHRQLMRKGVQPEPTPARPERLDVSESRLREVLRGGIPYLWPVPLEKDVTSALAIHVLRKGRECRRLERTPALFITANPDLARATRSFFSEDTVRGAIPHVVTDVSFTTQLWVRRPAEHREVPKRLLIAESHAALSQGPELWSRYLRAIESQRERGQIDDQQVKALVYAMESRESFLKLTHGNPDSVDEGTPLQVLDDLRSEIEDIANARVREASAEVASIARERDALRHEVGRKEDRIRGQSSEIADMRATIDDLREWVEAKNIREDRIRRAAGTAIAAIAAALALALPLSGAVTGSLRVATVSSVLVFLAVLSAAVGYRKGWKWMLAAVGAVGVVLAVPVGIKTIVGDDDGGAARERPTELPGAGRSEGSR